MNYKILWDKNRTRLEQKVIDALNNEWELVGGVSMTVTTHEEDGKMIESLVWAQSVYKKTR